MGRLSDADAEQIADEVGDSQSGRATEHHLITASRGELPPIRALLAPVRTSVGSTAMKVPGVEDVALSAASRRPAAELAVVSRLFVRPGARGRQLGEGLIRTTSPFGSSRGFGLVLEVVRAPRSAAIELYERLGCLVGHPPPQDGRHRQATDRSSACIYWVQPRPVPDRVERAYRKPIRFRHG